MYRRRRRKRNWVQPRNIKTAKMTEDALDALQASLNTSIEYNLSDDYDEDGGNIQVESIFIDPLARGKKKPSKKHVTLCKFINPSFNYVKIENTDDSSQECSMQPTDPLLFSDVKIEEPCEDYSIITQVSAKDSLLIPKIEKEQEGDFFDCSEDIKIEEDSLSISNDHKFIQIEETVLIKTEPNDNNNIETDNNENAVQNQENYVQNQENAVQNQENAVQNQENAVQNQENVVQNQENALQNQENAVQNQENAFDNKDNVTIKKEKAVRNKRNTIENKENVKGNEQNDVIVIKEEDNCRVTRRRSSLRNTIEKEAEKEKEKPKRTRKNASAPVKPPELTDPDRDIFCWKCHKFGKEVLSCTICPRVVHPNCRNRQIKYEVDGFICPECEGIIAAEGKINKLDIKTLQRLLLIVLDRMRRFRWTDSFEDEVDPIKYPDYRKYIVNPMYLRLLEINIQMSKYTTCELFVADAKWLLHNSYIYNSYNGELTSCARSMSKCAITECADINICHECYERANTSESEDWFIEVCTVPHLLVWARLKGWPFWPCKLTLVDTYKSEVEVRFFGDRHKSMVPVDCCYLYSKGAPSKQKKTPELIAAIEECEEHIKELEKLYFRFTYASRKIPLNPNNIDAQRRLILPFYGRPAEEIDKLRAALAKSNRRLKSASLPSTLSATVCGPKIKKEEIEDNSNDYDSSSYDEDACYEPEVDPLELGITPLSPDHAVDPLKDSPVYKTEPSDSQSNLQPVYLFGNGVQCSSNMVSTGSTFVIKDSNIRQIPVINVKSIFQDEEPGPSIIYKDVKIKPQTPSINNAMKFVIKTKLSNPETQNLKTPTSTNAKSPVKITTPYSLIPVSKIQNLNGHEVTYQQPNFLLTNVNNSSLVNGSANLKVVVNKNNQSPLARGGKIHKLILPKPTNSGVAPESNSLVNTLGNPVNTATVNRSINSTNTLGNQIDKGTCSTNVYYCTVNQDINPFLNNFGKVISPVKVYTPLNKGSDNYQTSTLTEKQITLNVGKENSPSVGHNILENNLDMKIDHQYLASDLKEGDKKAAFPSTLQKNVDNGGQYSLVNKKCEDINELGKQVKPLKVSQVKNHGIHNNNCGTKNKFEKSVKQGIVKTKINNFPLFTKNLPPSTAKKRFDVQYLADAHCALSEKNIYSNTPEKTSEKVIVQQGHCNAVNEAKLSLSKSSNLHEQNKDNKAKSHNIPSNTCGTITLKKQVIDESALLGKKLSLSTNNKQLDVGKNCRFPAGFQYKDNEKNTSSNILIKNVEQMTVDKEGQSTYSAAKETRQASNTLHKQVNQVDLNRVRDYRVHYITTASFGKQVTNNIKRDNCALSEETRSSFTGRETIDNGMKNEYLETDHSINNENYQSKTTFRKEINKDKVYTVNLTKQVISKQVNQMKENKPKGNSINDNYQIQNVNQGKTGCPRWDIGNCQTSSINKVQTTRPRDYPILDTSGLGLDNITISPFSFDPKQLVENSGKRTYLIWVKRDWETGAIQEVGDFAEGKEDLYGVKLHTPSQEFLQKIKNAFHKSTLDEPIPTSLDSGKTDSQTSDQPEIDDHTLKVVLNNSKVHSEKNGFSNSIEQIDSQIKDIGINSTSSDLQPPKPVKIAPLIVIGNKEETKKRINGYTKSILKNSSTYQRLTQGLSEECIEDLKKDPTLRPTYISDEIQDIIKYLKSAKHESSVAIKRVKDLMANVEKCDLQTQLNKRTIIENEKIVDSIAEGFTDFAVNKIEDLQSKKWCAGCSKEAIFYCCSAASYCSTECRNRRFASHSKVCTHSLMNVRDPNLCYLPSMEEKLLKYRNIPADVLEQYYLDALDNDSHDISEFEIVERDTPKVIPPNIVTKAPTVPAKTLHTNSKSILIQNSNMKLAHLNKLAELNRLFRK